MVERAGNGKRAGAGGGLVSPEPSMAKPISKNKRRRERREAYFRYLETALDDEWQFIRRVIATLDHRGLDIAPDGRPIKGGFWEFIRRRRAQGLRQKQGEAQRRLLGSSQACLDMVERAVGAVACNTVSKKPRK